MSKIDKTIRLVVAAAIFFVCGFICQSSWWVVGLLPLLTAVYGCPMYCVLRKYCKKSCDKDKK